MEKYFLSLIKENNVYKMIIEELIECKNYEIKLNNNDLSILLKSKINTIDEAYQYIINLFEYNKVFIKEIKINKSITIILKIYINQKEKDIEILLSYNKSNNYIMKINNEIKKITEEIKLLKEKIKILKNNNLKENKINKTDNNNFKKIDNKDNNIINPKNIGYLCDIVNDSYSHLWLTNTFSIFRTISDILYLVYSNQKKSIIFYNIINNKIIREIKNAHNEYITNFRYYLDKIKNRDLMLSISAEDNNIKLWNIYNNNIKCLLNITNINKNGWLESACILNDNNNNYIITSNDSYYDNENIKIFDFNGNKIKEINNSNDVTKFIDIYYEKKISKIYILTGNDGYIKSYDYNKNDTYKKYSDHDNNGSCCIIINKSKEDIIIIESSFDGNLRIWNFHSKELLKRIKISNECLRELCIWNNDYIFIGCDDKTIKIIEIKNGEIIKELKGHINEVMYLKIIIHPKYGKCLISQGVKNDSIKLWINKIN